MIIDKIAPKILKNSFDIAADKISKFSEQIDKSRKGMLFKSLNKSFCTA